MNLKIGPQDLGRKREHTFNGVRYTMEATDPYGLVNVFCHKTNSLLPSRFTGFKEAEQGATKHSLELTQKVK